MAITLVPRVVILSNLLAYYCSETPGSYEFVNIETDSVMMGVSPINTVKWSLVLS